MSIQGLIDMSKTFSELQMVLGQVAKDEKSRKFHSLYDKVSSEVILQEAFSQVIRNGGSGGIDGKEIKDYSSENTKEELIKEIQQELKTDSYTPQAVLRVYIPKPDGSQRPLGIPTIKDRIVQTAVKIVLEPIYEEDFCEYSYGFRPGRSCHQALQSVWKWLNFGYTEVIDADIRKFFDTIPHDKLLRTVASRISDGKLLKLIRHWLKATIEDSGKLYKPEKGTPQGGVISPLLANIYLNHLDQFWQKKGYIRYAKLVRYADDFVILCKQNSGIYLKEVKRLLQNLELELHETKTRVIDACKQGFDFLGFHIKKAWAYRPKQKKFGWVTGVRLSKKVLKKARKTLKEIVGQGGRKSPVPMKILVQAVNNWICHWMPYYCYANRKKDIIHVYLKIVLERLVLAERARKKSNKRRSRKWKSMNPKIWKGKYGLINMLQTYYLSRKKLYASLFEHPINALT